MSSKQNLLDFLEEAFVAALNGINELATDESAYDTYVVELVITPCATSICMKTPDLKTVDMLVSAYKEPQSQRAQEAEQTFMDSVKRIHEPKIRQKEQDLDDMLNNWKPDKRYVH